VVEDEAHNREAIGDVLTRLGQTVTIAADASDAMVKLNAESFDLVLSDVRMPGMSGIDFFRAAIKMLPDSLPKFAFMTAYGRLDEAVEAMRLGALHFLSKPIRKKDLEVLIHDVGREVGSKAKDSTRGHPHEPVVVSRTFAEVIQTIDRVAPNLASVLLVGESGVGKEVLARRLHAKSARTSAPFVAFHAGAVPESLVESELFGYVKGAFTGADQDKPGLLTQANGGTFFLDEIATMPVGVQAKLLRVIQERMVQPLGATTAHPIDVRWVAATNANLKTEAERGGFRQDLLYRLSVVEVEVPPLRTRVEDILPLTQAFLEEFSRREGRAVLTLNPNVAEKLKAYPWPGNVRELRNVVERAVALATADQFDVALLPEQVNSAEKSREVRIAVGTTLQSAEDKLIEETLRMCGGDKVQAAAILGVAPRTIYRWLEKRTQV